MLRTAWRKARIRAGLAQVKVHDLKHTFGRRLRSAGVSFEDRQDLLGHKSGRITTHYSAAELSNLLEVAEKACIEKDGLILTLIRRNLEVESRKSRVVDLDVILGGI
jgi:integrase